jgi:hypothetical protein
LSAVSGCLFAATHHVWRPTPVSSTGCLFLSEEGPRLIWSGSVILHSYVSRLQVLSFPSKSSSCICSICFPKYLVSLRMKGHSCLNVLFYELKYFGNPS